MNDLLTQKITTTATTTTISISMNKIRQIHSRLFRLGSVLFSLFHFTFTSVLFIIVIVKKKDPNWFLFNEMTRLVFVVRVQNLVIDVKA